MSSGSLEESSYVFGKAKPMKSSSACEGEYLPRTSSDHLPLVSDGQCRVSSSSSAGDRVAASCGMEAGFQDSAELLQSHSTVEASLHGSDINMEEGGIKAGPAFAFHAQCKFPKPCSELDVACVMDEGKQLEPMKMVSASSGWRKTSGDVHPASGGLDNGDNDICMVEGEYSCLPKVHAKLRSGKVLINNGISDSAVDMISGGVLNAFNNQSKAHDYLGLNGDISAKILMNSGNMHEADDPNSACLYQSTPGVRQYAPSIVEQQNPKFDNSSASPSPWSSPTTAWNRPRVVPMPSKKDLGQLSLDGTTALLDDAEIDAALMRLNGALVGRMFGRRIPYPQLSSELKRRWERFGAFRLVTLSSDRFICLFDCAAARDAVLMEGPWVLFGQVLGLDRWSPSFSLSSSDGFLTPVWVRMPELPFFCWTATNIARIVALIGEPLWIDSATDRLERGLFARACVRLDLSKPLKAGLWIEGKLGKFFQPLEYEGLSMFCFRCSQVGHKVNSCKLSVTKTTNIPCPKVPFPEVVSAKPISLDAGKESLQCDGVSNQVLGHVEDNSNEIVVPILDHDKGISDGNAMSQDLVDRGAGPWMIVARKRRPNKGGANAGLHVPMAQAMASGRVWLKQSTAGRGKQTNLANNYSHKSLFVKKGVDGNVSHWKSKVAQVQDHASSILPYMNNEKPILVGLTATPNSNEVKLDVHREDVRLDDKIITIPPATMHSTCSKDLVVGHCMIPKLTMCVDGPSSAEIGLDSSAEIGLDSSSSSISALIPYVNSDTSDKIGCGIKSLKKERMLNDLGPVSMTPRKRRMIVLNPDGGDASPSLPT